MTTAKQIYQMFWPYVRDQGMLEQTVTRAIEFALQQNAKPTMFEWMGAVLMTKWVRENNAEPWKGGSKGIVHCFQSVVDDAASDDQLRILPQIDDYYRSPLVQKNERHRPVPFPDDLAERVTRAIKRKQEQQ